MKILDEELELISDLAFTASMDCDCAIANLEDHETARGSYRATAKNVWRLWKK